MKFVYEALTVDGKRKRGEIEADHIEIAKQKLKREGKYLISLEESRDKRRERSFFFAFRSFGVKKSLPIKLARQLSSLLKGGVPLYQALVIVGNQTKSEKEKKIIHYLSERVREGISLSDALSDFPHIFDPFFIYSVKAGEKGGALDKILLYQANLLEQDANLRSKIKTALIYPAIMVVVGISVLFFLLSVVVPMMVKIFERMNQTLPFVTRALILLSDLVTGKIYILLAFFAILYILFVKVRKNERWEKLKASIILKIPLIGELYEMIMVERFTRILSTLLKSGVPMLQSLLVVSGAAKNPLYKEGIEKMAHMVERGLDLSAAIRQLSLFPGNVGDIIYVGEKGGNLEDMLDNISQSYENSITQRISLLTSLVEPVIILSLGAFVAFILVATLLPLFEMNRLILRR